MTILNEQFFKLSNAIFSYHLPPIQFAVYCYLVSCTGQKDYCWSSMRTIADNCNCAVNSARKAVDELVKRKFIRKTHTYIDGPNGRNRQGNNHYHILDMPEISLF